ncbi:MAG: DUF930 domain-containing protein [Phyllobacterium sp.]
MVGSRAHLTLVAGEPFLSVKARRHDALSIAASLAFHAIMVLAFIALPKPHAIRPHEEEAIELEIVPPEEPAAPAAAKPLDVPSSPELETPPRLPVEPLPQAAPAEPAMQRPATMLSAKVLADPRSRSAREALPTLEKEERFEQICGLEAMAQIAAWDKSYRPERIVAYAMAATQVEEGIIDAKGAAFRSRRKWYNLAFRCGISRESEKVVSFEFAVGKPIPESEWSSHGLAPVY